MEQLQATARKLLSNACSFAYASSLRYGFAEGDLLASSPKSDTEAVIDMAREWSVKGGYDWPLLAGRFREAQVTASAVYARNFISNTVHYNSEPLVRAERLLNERENRYPMDLGELFVGAHLWAKHNRPASSRLMKRLHQLRIANYEEAMAGRRVLGVSLEDLKNSPIDRPLHEWDYCCCIVALLENDDTLPTVIEKWRAYEADAWTYLQKDRPRGDVAARLHGSMQLSRVVPPAFFLRQWSFARELATDLEERFALASAKKPSELRYIKCLIHCARAMASYIDAQTDPTNSEALYSESLAHLDLYLKALKRTDWISANDIAPCVLLPAAILLKTGCQEKSFPFLSSIRLFPEIMAFDKEAYQMAKAAADGRDRLSVDWSRVVDELREMPFSPHKNLRVPRLESLRKQFADLGMPFPLDAER